MNINDEYPVTDPQLTSKDYLRNPVEAWVAEYNVGAHTIDVYSVYETQEEIDNNTPAFFNLNFSDTGECITEADVIYPEDIEEDIPSYADVQKYVEDYLDNCE